jgi:putative ABC transport system ATP-binding protein
MFIDVKELEKIYQTGDIRFTALKKVSFSMEKGQIGVILGPSGSGKSTLLNIIGGIDSGSFGRVIVNGREITKLDDKQLAEYRRTDIGFVFQFYNLIPNLTVYENICVSEDISLNPLDINELLKEIGLYELKDRYPRELSGGQQQRVSIARALVKNPKLLFCDEPTGALDYQSSKDILNLLEKICSKYQTTVLIITHNEAISKMAHRIIYLRSGEITKDIIQTERLNAEEVEW